MIDAGLANRRAAFSVEMACRQRPTKFKAAASPSPHPAAATMRWRGHRARSPRRLRQASSGWCSLSAALCVMMASCQISSAEASYRPQSPPHLPVYASRGWQTFNFRQRVDSALSTVGTILENTRAPTLAEAGSNHTYDDKYALSEFLTNAAMAAQLNVLERMGLDSAKLAKLQEMSATRSVTLRFARKDTCAFEKEVVTEQEGRTKVVEQIQTAVLNDNDDLLVVEEETKTRKVITTTTEYHWTYGVEYELYAFGGNEPQTRVELQGRRSQATVVTSTKTPPYPGSLNSETLTRVDEPFDVALTWLLQGVTAEGVCNFTIDRSAKSCHTPRRNAEIAAADDFFERLVLWGTRVHDSVHRITEVGNPERKKGVATQEGLFVPVLPLFEEPGVANASAVRQTRTSLGSMPPPRGEGGASAPSPLLSMGDANLFLDQQCKSLETKHAAIAEAYPAREGSEVLSVAEAWLLVLVVHSFAISEHWIDGVDHIEQMLRVQLNSAIGKTLQPKDFDEFMHHHDRKLFKPLFAPQPFSYAIRRPDHYPDGTLSIEGQGDDAPVMTVTRNLPRPGSARGEESGEAGLVKAARMSFPLNAATSVEFSGEVYLHGLVAHQFAGATAGVKLVARARQFSSFLLLVGKISGATSFAPEHAIILQNKDELLLPLLLEQMPTPKEFKDSIASLSPEQRRFASAVREMQLESSVFAVCIVQLKPQLEVLLGLDNDALTKEIKLTQDLLSLFIDYQIPSDLLTFDAATAGTDDATAAEKVTAVKGHVADVQEMIAAAKAVELQEQEEQTKMEEELAKAQRANKRRTAHFEMDEMAEPTVMMGGAMMMAGGSESAFAGESASLVSGRVSVAASESLHVSSGSLGFQTGAEIEAEQDVSSGPSTRDHSTGQSHSGSGGGGGEAASGVDLTQIPKLLDARFEALDEDAALRPTRIKTGERWTKKTHKGLLGKLSTSSMGSAEQKAEKDQAFDLLDALSRSGALPIASAELHVVVAATHCFDKSLLETVIQDNVNPIEKLERSALIMASAIHGEAATALLNDAQRTRVAASSPALFAAELSE